MKISKEEFGRMLEEAFGMGSDSKVVEIRVEDEDHLERLQRLLEMVQRSGDSIKDRIQGEK